MTVNAGYLPRPVIRTVRLLLGVTAVVWVGVVVIDHLAFGYRDTRDNQSHTVGGAPIRQDPSFPFEGQLSWEVVWATLIVALCVVAMLFVRRFPWQCGLGYLVVFVPYGLLLVVLWFQNPLVVLRFFSDSADIVQDPGPAWFLPVRHAGFALLLLAAMGLLTMTVLWYGFHRDNEFAERIRSFAVRGGEHATLRTREGIVACRSILAASGVLWTVVYLSDRSAFATRSMTGSRAYDSNSERYSFPPSWPREYVVNWELVTAVVVGAVCLVAVFTVSRWNRAVMAVVPVLGLIYLGIIALLWPNSPLLQAEYFPEIVALSLEEEPWWYLRVRNGAYTLLTAGMVWLVISAVSAFHGSRRKREPTTPRRQEQ